MVSLEKKLDILAEQFKQLTDQIKQLTDVYKSSIMEEQKSMKSYMEQAIEAVRKEVTETIRRMKTQPDVYHEVVSVTPQSVRKSIERKGLDSPNALILGVLNKTVTPTEMIFALEAIRARQKLRGKLID